MIEGADIVDAIAKTPAKQDRPVTDVVIKEIIIERVQS